MANNVILPGVGTITESLDAGGGVQRQVVTLRNNAGDAGDVIGSVQETSPQTDIAASGLNGRLQRIAQRLTTLIGATLQTSVADGQNVTLGARTDAKSPLTDASSISVMAVLKNMSYSLQQLVAAETPPNYILLTAAGVTGASVAVVSSLYNWFVWGTFGGATAQLQWSPDGGATWISIDTVVLTGNGGFNNVPILSGYVRVLITGGSSISLSSRLGGV